MEKITQITGRVVPVMIDDVDTDRIIPARFLRCITFDGIGEYAFYDERFDSEGKEKAFPMNEPKYKGASVIISGKNFGCGSSREHAPQSLKRAGVNAIIAESFAEIFFGNSLTIGLPCLTMAKPDIAELAKAVAAAPDESVSISLDSMSALFMGVPYKFTMPEVARSALINGSYDLLSELLNNKPAIDKVLSGLQY